MKIITKFCLTLLCIIAGVTNVSAAEGEKVHATFASPNNTNTTWDGATKTFTWSTTYYNQLRNIGLPSGDVSGYKKLVIDCDIVSGEKFRVLFYKGESNFTLWVENSGVTEFDLATAVTDASFLTECTEICLSGSNAAAPGEVKINDVYLEKEPVADPAFISEKTHATFASPNNTNTTWDGATKTFTWSTTYYNQLRNIGLPSGDVSGYKKLVIDCDIVSGEKFRVLFYKGESNFTLWVENSGVTEFDLATAVTDASFLTECTEICLSGSNAAAPGEVKINDVYLEKQTPATPGTSIEKTYATFASPNNTNTTWDGATKTFTWSTTYYNQLRNIGLPSGDVSGYKKLVIDCDIVSGEKFRVLFYKGSANFTVWVEKSGVTEIDLATAVTDASFLTECTEICLSGSNAAAPGEVKINAVYLTKEVPLVGADELPLLLTFPDYSEPMASYSAEWTADVNGKVWTLNGFNNQNNAWPYVACGRKKEATTATITSAPIYAEVKDVVLYVGERKNVEEATVVVNDEFGFPVDTIDVTDQFLAGYTEIQATPEESGRGYSYVITIKSAAGANGSTIINKVGLYGEKQYVNEPALLREAKAELEAEIAKAKTLAESGKTYGLEAFQAAIEKAEAALANESMKSAEMKAETAALQAAEKTFEEAKEPVVEVTYFTGADGNYYLKNVASGKFWGAGNEWSTRASLVQHAEFVTLKAQEDGTYTMDSQVRNGGDRHFFDGDYMDAAPINLTIIQKSAGAEETALTAEMFHEWDGIGADAQVAKENANPVFDLNKNLNSGATVYGNPSVVYLTYANLTGNDQLVIEGTPGLQLRVLLNRLEVGNGGGDANGGALVEKNPVIGENGKAEVDLTELEVAHLNAIKLGWGSPAGQITKIYAVKGGAGTPTYTIANGDKCFGYDGETTVLGKEVAADSENALWEILTEEDMKATLNDASKENPVDATFLILDPNFSRNNRFGKGLTSKSNGNDRNADLEPAWTFEATNKDNAGENTNFCVESWHATFTLAQTIENVPNGLYEMNAQGFYRNDNAEIIAALPYFYINEQKRDFPVKSGEENSMSDASKSFTEGLYQIEPVKVVVTDGKITLGAKNEEGLEYWCIWDNIELTYLGAATEDDIVATAIKDVEQKPAFENGAVYNLRGQKVQNPTKGLYIINGKKVVIK